MMLNEAENIRYDGVMVVKMTIDERLLDDGCGYDGSRWWHVGGETRTKES